MPDSGMIEQDWNWAADRERVSPALYILDASCRKRVTGGKCAEMEKPVRPKKQL